MRLFRAKCFFANGAGFIHEGQLFLVDEPNRLPIPHAASQASSLEESLRKHYEEIVSPNALFPLSKFLNFKEL